MNHFDKLKFLRSAKGKPKTTGLSDDKIEKFLKFDAKLGQAIDEAYARYQELHVTYRQEIEQDEAALIQDLQKHFVNFYAADAVNPYVPLAARGPWIVTYKGAVIHDSGGYGMLGFGHAPESILKAMNSTHIMANIMTANFSQKRFSDAMFKEIGFRRSGAKRKPFEKFLCLNSGSESVTMAARFSDINAKLQTDPGGKHAGKKIKFLAVEGGFHGRTDRPAQVSSSSIGKYKQFLASFRDSENLHTVRTNNVKDLGEAFSFAEKNNIFFEAFFAEPVMGEGNPGQAMTREFYDAARRLTAKHHTLFIIDSIQAGLRAHGTLSIVDYPGFEDCDPPDMETYSKALNAGQYPLSVLAMRKEVADIYKTGVYGNTMTANPRALEIATAVLSEVTPELRNNISARGKEFVEKMLLLKKEFPQVIEDVKGTGLLCAMFIYPKAHKVLGVGGLEERMRTRGFGVIHGGENALRFTPHFRITSEEIDLMISGLRDVLR